MKTMKCCEYDRQKSHQPFIDIKRFVKKFANTATDFQPEGFQTLQFSPGQIDTMRAKDNFCTLQKMNLKVQQSRPALASPRKPFHLVPRQSI
jgi:hypothetical protein